MEEFGDENDDFLELKLMLQVEPKKSLGVDATRYEMAEEEEEYYLQKIREFIDQKKIELCSHQDHSSDREVVVVKDAKKKKKPAKKRPRENDGNEKKQKKKRIQNVGSAISSEISERLKEVITQEMKGSDLKLVIKKQLYATDLSKTQNRLSMPINQLETHEFLTADEKRLLDAGGSFDVSVLGPTLQMHEKPMKLKRWNLVTSSNYNLITNWYKFVANNSEDLTVNTKVQVWSFRKDGQLCFAIACVGRDDI